ncbi:MAG: hypothetical protein ABJM43_12965, partial [Paracoccaceae bacterium]
MSFVPAWQTKRFFRHYCSHSGFLQILENKHQFTRKILIGPDAGMWMTPRIIRRFSSFTFSTKNVAPVAGLSNSS